MSAAMRDGGEPGREGPGLAAAKFSRLSRRGVLLGLSVGQMICCGSGVFVCVVALYTAGVGGLAWSAAAWLPLFSAALVPVQGRKLVDWIPVTAHWLIRLVMRQTIYRRRIVKLRPAGTLALPGDAAALRLFEDPETQAVMVHDPHGMTLTAVIDLSHPSFMLLDEAEQQRRVAGWGRVLATCCRSGRIRLQVLERTLADSGTGIAQWWAEHGTDDGSWVARTYSELIERAGPAGERHVTTISLALDTKAAARAIRAAGGGVRGAAHVLRAEMSTLTSALRVAELKPSTWYRAGDLALVLRSVYDPAIASTLERNGELGRDLAAAGPVAVEESWGHLRSDSAFHAVLWISEWPRSLVYPGFLAPLLLTSGIRRSFTLLCNPIRVDLAVRDIRRKKVEYITDATQRARIGQIDDAQQNAEFADVLQQEADMTAGHGIVRYTGLIAISADTRDDLDTAIAEVEQAAIQASCETRRLVGQQAQAFTVAALPLCRGI